MILNVNFKSSVIHVPVKRSETFRAVLLINRWVRLIELDQGAWKICVVVYELGLMSVIKTLCNDFIRLNFLSNSNAVRLRLCHSLYAIDL